MFKKRKNKVEIYRVVQKKMLNRPLKDNCGYRCQTQETEKLLV